MPRQQSAPQLSLTALTGIGEVRSGDELAAIIAAATEALNYVPVDGDVLVISQKIVSKAEGRRVSLTEVTPSARAREVAKASDKEPALVELILRESDSVLRVRPGLIIVRHRLGIVLANAGIDQSNVGDRSSPSVLLLPENPDRSAAQIKAALSGRFDCRLAVLIIDSVGRAWRQGVVGLTIGSAGIAPLLDLLGTPDRDGRELAVTEVALADQIAAAASLLMGEAAEGIPAVWLRGLRWQPSSANSTELLRPKERDLFQ